MRTLQYEKMVQRTAVRRKTIVTAAAKEMEAPASVASVRSLQTIA